MAEIVLNARGNRWPALAKLIIENTPEAESNESNGKLRIRAPYITVTRGMVEQTLFPEGPKNPKTVEKVLYGLALVRKGRLVVQNDDRIVIGDDDGERATTLRMRVDQLEDISRLAKQLGMSRNQFVITAIEHFVRFLEDSQRLLSLDEEENQ